jgi:excinuclease ABC subunit C
MNKNLEDKLRLLPGNPGVYFMKNREGKIIYVGKAKVLKNRVRSYFTNKHHDRKTKRLVANINDLEYLICRTEEEALIVEANMIKKHLPHYNILLKDDKQFPFIKLTLREPFPRIFVTRNVVKDGSKYFGPFTKSGTLKRTLRMMEWMFPHRTCKRNIPLDRIAFDKACINHQMGKCPAPCIGKISKKDYFKNIRQILRLLNGKNETVIKMLTDEMMDFADKMEFEKAAVIRDKIDYLNRFKSTKLSHFNDNKNRDIIGFYRDETHAAVSVIKIINGKLMQKEIYNMDQVVDDENKTILAQFIQQYYSADTITKPHKIMIPFEPASYEVLNKWLNKKLIIPIKGENRKLIGLAKANALNHVEEQKLKHLRKSGRSILPVQELKEKLNLRHMPRKMVCFDISTIQGTDTVSSMVYFENGKPKKKNYRNFVMKTVIGQDDFASMAETLNRFLSKIEDYEKPDLIVIDGGKGQLSAAYAILEKYNLDIEMISLAKRIEEVFKPGSSDSIILSKSSPALRMLIHLRDESHRFAVTFHRKRRSLRTLKSELDGIPGVGNERKFLLLKTFGSVQKIKEANVIQLCEVKGIGIELAKVIKKHLSEE